MKKIITIGFILISCIAYSQQGIIKESLKLNSPILDKEVEYCISLPADYETSNRWYPVLYLLHGFSDDETGWTQFGEAHIIAGKLIQKGEVPPMIIVMPDAGVSWYINSADGKTRYEDFFIQEFIPYIEKTYRIRTKKEFRAIAGLSMGGYGSIIMALKHPELFTATAPLSAGILTDEEYVNMPEDNWNKIFSIPFGNNVGEDRLTDHYYENSVLKIIESGNTEEFRKVRYYIDCGDDDFLIKGNMALHALMIDKEIPHEFRVHDGGHTWSYWRTALPEVLRFVGESFHR